MEYFSHTYAYCDEDENLILAEKAIDASILKNNDLEGAMNPDQEYWYQMGYIDGFKEGTEHSKIHEK